MNKLALAPTSAALAALAMLATLAACGPKPAPVAVPMLPGDGTAHTAKPEAAPTTQEADPWTGRTDLISPPAPPTPAALAIPPVQSYKLGNGLEVYVIKNDRLPVVSFDLAIKAGRAQEPLARLGVSEATADMLVKGTRKHDAVALAKAIDFVGGTIGADATFEATLLSCSVLSRNRSTCLDLLPEMIMQSTFPDAELGKVKRADGRDRAPAPRRRGHARVRTRPKLAVGPRPRARLDQQRALGRTCSSATS